MTIIYDLFDIEYGQKIYHSKEHLIDKNGKVPLISSKGSNRGIYGDFDIEPKYENIISVPSTGTVCYAIYQKEKCCVDDNCLVLTPKKKFTEEEMIYYSLLIRKEKYKYMYGRQVTPKRLGNTQIPNTIPKFINKNSSLDFSNLSSKVISKNINLNRVKWDFFDYNEIFDVVKGKRVVMSEIETGNNIFVSAIDSNNGVSMKSNLKPIFKENTITVNYDGNGVALAYYQNKPYWALDSVNVLEAKFNLNKYIAMFLITIIKKEKHKFSYGRKWHKERMEKSKILLPIDDKGNPNWSFMEDYIKSLPFSSSI